MKKALIALCLIGVWVFASPSASQAQTQPPESSLQVTPAVTRLLIDSLRQSLYRNYIFPDTALKMIRYVEGEFKKGAYTAITDPRILAERINQDLQKAHRDGHFHIIYNPRFARDLADTVGRAARQRQGDSMQLAHSREDNFTFREIKILPGNIGYIVFHGFSGFVNEARPIISGAFRFLSNTNALIIDLRENGGGSPNMVSQIESYFFPQKTHLNDIVYRSLGKTEEFWADPAKAEGTILKMPVYILTSRSTYSAAEDFTYGMQSIKRAIVVGDTTGGGAHPARPFPVGQGFVAVIPHARSLNPYTHTDWEGTGVRPDIPVAANKALQAAQMAFQTERLNKATSDIDKNSAQWQINDLLVRQKEELKDSAFLSSYTGTYQGGLVFYVSQSALYCKNAERGNEVFKLSFISGNRFVLDENVQVEFIKDNQGKFSSMKMWWRDGRVSDKPKVE
jgi:retinol-binding protein 3